MDNQKKQSAIAPIIAKFKKVKHIEIFVAVIAVLIMLAIYFSTLGSSDSKSKTKTTTPASELTSYCQMLQDELETLISKLSGAGNAKVLISWESSIELILAQSTNASSGSSSSTPTIIQGSNGSAPVVLKEIYPKAVGVLVICVGGNDPKIKVNIIMAVSTLLDISSDKVIVYAMTK